MEKNVSKENNAWFSVISSLIPFVMRALEDSEATNQNVELFDAEIVPSKFSEITILQEPKKSEDIEIRLYQRSSPEGRMKDVATYLSCPIYVSINHHTVMHIMNYVAQYENIPKDDMLLGRCSERSVRFDELRQYCRNHFGGYTVKDFFELLNPNDREQAALFVDEEEYFLPLLSIWTGEDDNIQLQPLNDSEGNVVVRSIQLHSKIKMNKPKEHNISANKTLVWTDTSYYPRVDKVRMKLINTDMEIIISRDTLEDIVKVFMLLSQNYHNIHTKGKQFVICANNVEMERVLPSTEVLTNVPQSENTPAV